MLKNGVAGEVLGFLREVLMGGGGEEKGVANFLVM